ncbi:MAG: ATP-binding cassette domain-containing protein [Longimicrobiales bacterium]
MNAPAGVPALQADGVVKRYGPVTALDEVTLRVAPGECVALVGESGSGKTTLLRCFNAMVSPDSGSIQVGDRDARADDPVALRRSLGYVQQDGGLVPHWTVRRNVALVPWLRDEPDADDRARSVLDLVGLPDGSFGARYPRELSGGQRQRVALARALAHGPDVILLDEPFGALDAITRSDLQRAFSDLVGRLGVTVLLVTHDLREAMLLADRVAVLREGRIERVAASDDLRRDPGDGYVGALFRRAGVA